LRIKEADI
jgi:hypothetical protein